MNKKRYDRERYLIKKAKKQGWLTLSEAAELKNVSESYLANHKCTDFKIINNKVQCKDKFFNWQPHYGKGRYVRELKKQISLSCFVTICLIISYTEIFHILV